MPIIANPMGNQILDLLLFLDPNNPDVLGLQEDTTRYVSGLLFDKQGREIQVPLRKFMGKSYTVLGMSGMGKSSFVRSFIYYCLLPHNYPFTVFDVEGEYYPFADRFPQIQLWDQEMRPGDAHRLARNAIFGHRPTVLDFSNSDETEFTRFAYEYLDALWVYASIIRRTYGKTLPHLCIFEEAQEIAKQWPDRFDPMEKKAKEMVKRYARRGRKFGPTIMLVSQRIPDMDTASVAQTQTKFLLKSDSDVDRKRYGGWLAIGEKTINRIMNYMKAGEVIIYEGKVARDEFGNVDIPIYPFAYLDWADVSPSVRYSDLEEVANLLDTHGGEIDRLYMQKKQKLQIPQLINRQIFNQKFGGGAVDNIASGEASAKRPVGIPES
jgi:hypothetical protein